MDILIGLLLVFGALLMLALIVALFVRNEYSLEREIIIRKPNDEVFNYVRLLRNQDHYSKWVMTDPDMKKDFRGQDGTVGFVYAWDGNKKAGKGEQEITGIREGQSLDIEVRFIRPFESTASTPMKTEKISDAETRVIWGMQGKSKYPLNLMNLFMDSMLGKDLETSLVTLKNNLERRK